MQGLAEYSISCGSDSFKLEHFCCWCWFGTVNCLHTIWSLFFHHQTSRETLKLSRKEIESWTDKKKQGCKTASRPRYFMLRSEVRKWWVPHPPRQPRQFKQWHNNDNDDDGSAIHTAEKPAWCPAWQPLVVNARSWWCQDRDIYHDLHVWLWKDWMTEPPTFVQSHLLVGQFDDVAFSEAEQSRLPRDVALHGSNKHHVLKQKRILWNKIHSHTGFPDIEAVSFPGLESCLTTSRHFHVTETCLCQTQTWHNHFYVFLPSIGFPQMFWNRTILIGKMFISSS